jgi:hypothetical protein
MGSYKFASEQVAPLIAKQGIVRATRMSVFKRMEDEQKIRGIGDRLEGKSVVALLQGQYSPQGTEADKAILSSMGVEVTEAEYSKNLVFERIIFERTLAEDPFVFCFSVGELDALTRDMQSRHEDRPACVEILRPDLLAHRIRHHGKIANMGNVRLHNILRFSQLGPVEYGPVEQDFTQRPMRQPSPWFKDSFFQYQQEHRIVLLAEQTLESLPEHLDIVISKPNDLFRRVR